MRPVGEAAALIAAFTWSATSVAMASLSSRTTPVAMSALRLSVATLLLPFVLLVSGEAGQLTDVPWSVVIAMAGSGVLAGSLGDTLYIAALGELGVQRAFTLTTALFIGLTVAGGVVLLDESLHWYQGVGAVLVAGGILLLVRSRTGDIPRAPRADWLGFGLVGIVAISWAAATLWLAGQRGDLGAIAASAIRTPAATVGMLVFAFATAPKALAAPLRTFNHAAAIAGVGVMALIGGLLYVYAVGEAGAARTTILNAASPMMALPLSIIFLKEPFTRAVAAGTAVCVAGIVLVVL